MSRPVKPTDAEFNMADVHAAEAVFAGNDEVLVPRLQARTRLPRRSHCAAHLDAWRCAVKCDLCLTYEPAEFLSVCDVFPLSHVCDACQAELLADEEDPIDHEAREECGR